MDNSSTQSAPARRFELGRVPNSYAGVFVRRVGLWPLVGTAQRDVHALTLWILERWQRRINRLIHWGFLQAHDPQVKSKSRRGRMLNCPPSFCFCTPRTPACMMEFVCPFCCSRHALDFWRRLDRALFGRIERPVIQDELPVQSCGQRRRRTLDFVDVPDIDVDVGPPADKPRAPTQRDDLALIVRRVPYTLWRDSGCWSPGTLIGHRLGRNRVKGSRRRASDIPIRKSELDRLRRIGVLGGIDVTNLWAHYAKTPDGAAQLAEHTPGKKWFRGLTVQFSQVMFCPIEKADAITHNGPDLCVIDPARPDRSGAPLEQVAVHGRHGTTGSPAKAGRVHHE
jgi:hypothetical protein